MNSASLKALAFSIFLGHSSVSCANIPHSSVMLPFQDRYGIVIGMAKDAIEDSLAAHGNPRRSEFEIDLIVFNNLHVYDSSEIVYAYSLNVSGPWRNIVHAFDTLTSKFEAEYGSPARYNRKVDPGDDLRQGSRTFLLSDLHARWDLEWRGRPIYVEVFLDRAYNFLFVLVRDRSWQGKTGLAPRWHN
jgi:hypothetical protein